MYVVGARPNFVKMAPVVAELRASAPEAEHVLIHTGQHYDREMSDIFLEQLGMPAARPSPGRRLRHSRAADRRGSWSASSRCSRPSVQICVIVPGDVNSTLAAVLVAAKLHVPTAHLEAGLRSFDRSMPEEINRIVADQFADLLFAHSDEALENLEREGIDSNRCIWSATR